MNAVAAPKRSAEQRNAALREGNRVRLLRADAKRELTLERCIDYVELPPPWMLRMPLVALLVAVPKLGPVSVRKLLRSLYIADVKTVGGLSSRQRACLLAALRERA